MTEKKSKPNLEEIKQALSELPVHDLFNIISRELDRRRLDEHGNPTDPPGLYYATMTGVGGLLGEHDEAVERIAAVGRGVQLKPDAQSSEIREVALDLDSMRSTNKWANTEKAEKLANTWSQRFGRAVDASEVQGALNNANEHGMITDAMLAIRGYRSKDPKDRKDERRDLYNAVRRALKLAKL